MHSKWQVRWVLKAGVHKAKPIILEPIMKMEVITPKEFMGDVIGDISSRTGSHRID